MKYSVNWVQTKSGNAAKQGQVVTINVAEADFIVYGVYKDGFPVLVGQTRPGDNEDSFILKRKGIDLKGKATLKVSAYNKKGNRFGWTDEFNII